MLIQTPPTAQEELDTILEHLGQVLDIPEELYLEAVARYEEVGAHLGRRESRLFPHFPKIYPQGSIVLGTMILPASAGCEYDVDSVCLIHLAKTAITQAELKRRVGDELRLAYQEVLRARRRCWTLQFKAKFHLDVLPAIPDLDQGGTAILLTDTELTRWQHSNPRAFALWFQARMAVNLQERKKALALKLRASVEQIPDWRVRTPLQRAIQLMKRHRDLFFQSDLDKRPASIIITTLAARAYGGEESILDALASASSEMIAAAKPVDGVYRILNPVNPLENFADKWNEDPGLANGFLRWVVAFYADVVEWRRTRSGILHLSESLSPRFGSGIVEKALVRYGTAMKTTRDTGALAVLTGSGRLVTAGPSRGPAVTVRPHTFFGE